MKVLYLGYAVSKKEASALYGASVAGNLMQVNLLKNLSKYPDLMFHSITIYPVAAYPQGKLVIKKKYLKIFPGFISLKIGMINLPIMKQLMETIVTYQEAKRIIEKEKIKVILTFNMFPEIGLPALWLKKRYGCEIISVLADLPIDDTLGRKGISAFLRWIMDLLTCYAIPRCDKIITLNSYAVKRFAPHCPYLVVEGGVEEEDLHCEEEANEVMDKQETKETKILLYSGALSEYSGIMKLIEAMKMVDLDISLHIYGSGQLKEEVIQCVKALPNVYYGGKIEPERLRQLQRSADLLINPRPVNHPIARVTFPSKIFEYLLSGTPVLTTKLNGFTEDYLSHMYVVRENDPKLLADKINEVMSLATEERRNKGLEAKSFVLKYKTWKKQCEKIYTFIKDGTL
ncbi:MAG: putative glycosyltransferase [Herbinix sp.]|jgi:glycosyltransferase involved in cell wall biosynthesis|nr:putative glycosyltransferase [Herbinix sp.]